MSYTPWSFQFVLNLFDSNSRFVESFFVGNCYFFSPSFPSIFFSIFNFNLFLFSVLEALIAKCPSDRQICLFSATFPVTAKSFKQKFLPNAYVINLMDELTLRGISQFYAFVEERQKVHLFLAIFPPSYQSSLLHNFSLKNLIPATFPVPSQPPPLIFTPLFSSFLPSFLPSFPLSGSLSQHTILKIGC